MATAVLVIVCVVHRRRRRSRQQRKSAEQRRLSADALAAAAADAVVDGRSDCVKDGSVEVRYVGRSANCTPAHATGNSVTSSSRNPGATSSTGRASGAGKRLLKEKTEKVSIV